MKASYLIFRFTQLTSKLHYLTKNKQAKFIATILLISMIGNNLVIFCAAVILISNVAILANLLNINLFILVFILTSFTAMVPYTKTNQFIVIDKLNSSYVIWDQTMPLKFSTFRSFNEVKIFDNIVVKDLNLKVIDNSYLNSLNINHEVTGDISNQSESWLSFLSNLKTTLLSKIDTSLSTKTADLIKGFLFGSSTLSDPELKDNLKTLGLSHIISVSGFNFTIIQSLIINLAIFLNKRILYLITIVFFLLFYFFIGIVNLSAYRAMIMILISTFGLFNGFPIRKTNLMLLAILSLIILSPNSLSNISFQLSITAVIGLTFFTDFFLKNIQIGSERIKQTLVTSMVAFLSTFPILFLNFETLSWGGLLMNFIFLPFVPILMLLGFIISLIGNESNIGVFLVNIAEIISKTFINLTEVFSKIEIFNIKREYLVGIILTCTLLYIIYDFKKWSKRYYHWKL